MTKISYFNYIISLLFFICLIACKTNYKNNNTQPLKITKFDNKQNTLDSIFRVEKFSRLKTYKPLSLMFKNKAIFGIGQNYQTIDSSLSFRPDPNLKYQYYFSIVIDYLSMDNKLSIDLGNHSSINGIIFFSVERQENQIFHISGNWRFDLYEKKMEQIAIDAITTKLFPILKDKLELRKNWTYSLESKNQIEHFKILQRDSDKGWGLTYRVELK